MSDHSRRGFLQSITGIVAAMLLPKVAVSVPYPSAIPGLTIEPGGFELETTEFTTSEVYSPLKPVLPSIPIFEQIPARLNDGLVFDLYPRIDMTKVSTQRGNPVALIQSVKLLPERKCALRESEDGEVQECVQLVEMNIMIPPDQTLFYSHGEPANDVVTLRPVIQGELGSGHARLCIVGGDMQYPDLTYVEGECDFASGIGMAKIQGFVNLRFHRGLTPDYYYGAADDLSGWKRWYPTMEQMTRPGVRLDPAAPSNYKQEIVLSADKLIRAVELNSIGKPFEVNMTPKT